MGSLREQRMMSLGALVLFASLVIACAGVTDAGITAEVKAKLAADSTVNGSEITVSTKDQVVTLTGNIDSQEAKDRALKIARESTGVRDVRDMISVREASAEGNAPPSASASMTPASP